MQHEFTGVFIPAHIWLSPDLSPAEKMMLGEVDALSRRTGWCTAGRQHFATWLHCTLPNVTYYTRRLEEMGFLEIVRDAGGASKMRVVGARFYENPAGSKEVLPVNTVNGGSKSSLRGVVNTVNGGSKERLPEIEYKENSKENIKYNDMPLSENESDYVKIETWSAETKIVPLNTASPKQDTPCGGASLNRYSDTDAELLRERDPLKTTNGRKAGSKTGAEIEKIAEVIDYLNLRTGAKFRPNSGAALKYIGARLKDGYSVADMVRVIDRKVSEWLRDVKMRQYLTPDTLFNKEKFEKYMGQLEMAAPAKPQTPTTPARRVQMDEPDFEMYGEKQAF